MRTILISIFFFASVCSVALEVQFPIAGTMTETRRLGAAYDPGRPSQTVFTPVLKKEKIKKVTLGDEYKGAFVATQDITIGAEEQLDASRSSASAKAAYGFINASASIDQTKSSGNASRCVTLKLTVILLDKVVSLSDEIDDSCLTDNAKSLLDQSKFSDFVQIYGTHLISDEFLGHSITLSITFKATKDWDQKRLVTAVEAAYNGLRSGAQVNYDATEDTKHLKENVAIQIESTGIGMKAIPQYDANFLDNPGSISSALESIRLTLKEQKTSKPAIIGLGFRENPVLLLKPAYKFPMFNQRDLKLKLLYAKFCEMKVVEFDADYRLQNSPGIGESDKRLLSAIREVFQLQGNRLCEDGRMLLQLKPDSYGQISVPPVLSSDSSDIVVSREAAKQMYPGMSPTNEQRVSIPCVRPIDVKWPRRPDSVLPLELTVSLLEARAVAQEWPAPGLKPYTNYGTDRGRYTFSILFGDKSICPGTLFVQHMNNPNANSYAINDKVPLDPSATQFVFRIQSSAKFFSGDTNLTEGSVNFEEPNPAISPGLTLSYDILREILNRARNSQYALSEETKSFVDNNHVQFSNKRIKFSLSSGRVGRGTGYVADVEIAE